MKWYIVWIPGHTYFLSSIIKSLLTQQIGKASHSKRNESHLIRQLDSLLSDTELTKNIAQYFLCADLARKFSEMEQSFAK